MKTYSRITGSGQRVTLSWKAWVFLDPKLEVNFQLKISWGLNL
jgi:hypothetical protein